MIKIKDPDMTIDDGTKIRTIADERKFSTLKGSAEVLIQDSSVHVTNVNNGLLVSEYGTIVKGATHLADTPSNIRINGFWVFNDELLTTLPSTTYTPIPVLVYKDSPYIKMIRGFMMCLNS